MLTQIHERDIKYLLAAAVEPEIDGYCLGRLGAWWATDSPGFQRLRKATLELEASGAVSAAVLRRGENDPTSPPVDVRVADVSPAEFRRMVRGAGSTTLAVWPNDEAFSVVDFTSGSPEGELTVGLDDPHVGAEEILRKWLSAGKSSFHENDEVPGDSLEFVNALVNAYRSYIEAFKPGDFRLDWGVKVSDLVFGLIIVADEINLESRGLFGALGRRLGIPIVGSCHGEGEQLLSRMMQFTGSW